ncbi:MAG: MoaD/ThiS family protein [Clostridia bacterium]|nr:MoaD/ThiS family protein [Clostridia bacterium]
MNLEIRLFADLPKKVRASITAVPGEAFILELPEGTTLGQVFAHLGLEGEQTLIGLVNGLRQLGDYELKDGDRIGIFPPVGGG